MTEPALSQLGSLPKGSGFAWNHVGLTVADMDRSVDFWVRHFGFEMISRRGGSADFLKDLLSLTEPTVHSAFLRSRDHRLLLELVQHVPAGRSGDLVALNEVGSAHLCFWVEEIDELVDQLRIDGAELISRRIVQLDGGPLAGGRSVYVRTPDGVILELHCPDKKRLYES